MKNPTGFLSKKKNRRPSSRSSIRDTNPISPISDDGYRSLDIRSSKSSTASSEYLAGLGERVGVNRHPSSASDDDDNYEINSQNSSSKLQHKRSGCSMSSVFDEEKAAANHHFRPSATYNLPFWQQRNNNNSSGNIKRNNKNSGIYLYNSSSSSRKRLRSSSSTSSLAVCFASFLLSTLPLLAWSALKHLFSLFLIFLKFIAKGWTGLRSRPRLRSLLVLSLLAIAVCLTLKFGKEENTQNLSIFTYSLCLFRSKTRAVGTDS